MSVFTIEADGKSIACHTCGMTGRNLSDVTRHCGCFRLLQGPQERPTAAPEPAPARRQPRAQHQS